MKTTLTTNEAANLLLADEYAGWTYAGAYALVEYLEELEDDTGEEIEFDRVAIRCDFAEYSSLADFMVEYFADQEQAFSACGIDDDMDADERDERIADYIRDNGHLIEFDGGIIVSSF